MLSHCGNYGARPALGDTGTYILRSQMLTLFSCRGETRASITMQACTPALGLCLPACQSTQLWSLALLARGFQNEESWASPPLPHPPMLSRTMPYFPLGSFCTRPIAETNTPSSDWTKPDRPIKCQGCPLSMPQSLYQKWVELDRICQLGHLPGEAGSCRPSPILSMLTLSFDLLVAFTLMTGSPLDLSILLCLGPQPTEWHHLQL